MDPDALHHAEEEHADEDEGSGIANERERNPGDGHERHAHADVLKDVGKHERDHARGNDLAGEISTVKRDKEALNKEEGEARDEKDASPEALLLGDDREDVVVVSGAPGNVLAVMKRALGLASIAHAAPPRLPHRHGHPVLSVVLIGVDDVTAFEVLDEVIDAVGSSF